MRNHLCGFAEKRYVTLSGRHGEVTLRLWGCQTPLSGRISVNSGGTAEYYSVLKLFFRAVFCFITPESAAFRNILKEVKQKWMTKSNS